MKNLKFLSLVMLLSVTFFACKKAVTDHEENYPHAQVQSQTTTFSNWIGGGDGYEATVNVPFITSEVNNNGLIACYLQEGNEWIALPVTISSGIWVEHFIFSTQIGAVNFYAWDDDGLTPNPGSTTVKIVAVSSVGLIQNPNVDFTDYEQVKETFHLD